MRSRALLAASVVLVLAGAPACSKKTTPGQTEAKAYKEAKSAYYDAETPEAKAVIAERYLAEFPGGEHAPAFVRVEVENRGTRLGEKQRALDTVRAALQATGDPGRHLEIVLTAYPLAKELDQPLDLTAAIAQVEKERPLSYDENGSIMEVAAKHRQWQLLLQRADAALAQATPEAVRADNPGRKLGPAKLQHKVDGRAAEAMTYKAWALANTGKPEQAEELFAAARKRTPRSFLGLSLVPVALFEGRAALQQGRLDRAMELLAPDAVMGGDSTAMAYLETAWKKKNGSEKGLDDYLHKMRRVLSREAADFTLPDYQGEEHTFSKELGRVTLLAFWFPT
ncbi:MAG: hypothetical protein GXP47_02345 [Acidobacteria bacterium]|nr:hypothetical protein [Acidobacteriota bacterium]